MGLIVNFKGNNKYFDRTNTLVSYFNDIKRFDGTINPEDEVILLDLCKNGTKKEQKKDSVPKNRRCNLIIHRFFSNTPFKSCECLIGYITTVF